MPTTTTKTKPSTQSTAKSSNTSAKKKSASAGDNDAISLLTEDHKEVQQMFKHYQKLVDAEAEGEARQALAEQICLALTVHAQIEEELFYPAVRDAVDAAVLLDEAEVEHASAKDLIAQIQSMNPEEPLYDAKVTVLGEYIQHHVKEEQDEMFPKAKKKLDTAALGARLASRKHALMAEMGGDDMDEDEEATAGSGNA